MAQFGQRYSHCGLVFDDKMWVMGGDIFKNGNYSFANDVWCSGDGVTWTQVTAAAQWPKRDAFAGVVFNNKMWIMGGMDDNTEFRDVWSSSDGKTWTQATANAAWPHRWFFSAVVFDNKMWVLGGYGRNEKLLKDAWYSSDGANWTQATASAQWPERFAYATVAYDNKLWMIAGMNRTGNLNDVWYLESTSGINDQMHKTGSNNLFEIAVSNPLHGNIQIRFQVQQASSVGISISNSAGRKIALVCSGTYAVGEHTVTWNGLTSRGVSVPCGIYFVRLITDAGDVTKKIVIDK